MKLIVISSCKPLSRDALSITSLNMAGAFKEIGMDVEVITPYKIRNGKEVKEFYQLNVSFPIHSISILKPPKRYAYFLFSVLSSFFYRIKRIKEKFIIYTDFPWVAIFSPHLGLPTIFSPDTYQPYRLYYSFLITASLRKKFLVFVCMSSTLADSYKKDGVPPNKIITAPLGVNLNRYSSPISQTEAREILNLPQPSPLITLIGDLYPGRGAEVLIECATRFKDAIFLLGGATLEQQKYLNDIIASKGLSNIIIKGFIPIKDVPLYEWASDILVAPYTTKTLTHNIMCPLKIFDYMAAGRPIVASDFPPLHDILMHRKNAILVPPEDIESWCNSFEEILNNKELYTSLSQNALQTAKEFTWINRARKILEFLQIKGVF